MPPAPRFDRVQESAEGAAVRSLDGKLMRLAEARVPELDLKNPEGDWARFEADIVNKVHALGGQELMDALEYDADIPRAVLNNGPADDGVNVLTRPQQMQWALNGIILNSLPRYQATRPGCHRAS